MALIGLRGTLRRPLKLPKAPSRSNAAGLLLKVTHFIRLFAAAASLRIFVIARQGSQKLLLRKTQDPNGFCSIPLPSHEDVPFAGALTLPVFQTGREPEVLASACAGSVSKKS